MANLFDDLPNVPDWALSPDPAEAAAKTWYQKLRDALLGTEPDNYGSGLPKPGESVSDYVARTGGTETPDNQPMIPASVFEAGYKTSPLYWAGKYFAPEQTEGISKGLAQTAAGLTTDDNLELGALTAPIGGVGGTVGKLAGTTLGAAFEAQAIKDLPDQWDRFQKTTDSEEKWQLGTQIAAQLGLPLTAVFHAASGEPKGLSESTDANVAPKQSEQTESPATSVQSELPQRVTETAPEARTSDQPRPLTAGDPALASEAQAAIRSGEIQNGEDFDNWLAKRQQGELAEVANDVARNGEQLTATQAAEDQSNGGERSINADQGAGIANRYVEEDINSGTLPADALVTGEGWNAQEALERGRELINRGVDPRLVSDALNGNRRFPAGVRDAGDAVAVLHAERERLATERTAAQNATLANPKDPALAANARATENAELNFLRNTKPKAGGLAQRMMVAFQDAQPADLGTFDGLYRKAIDLNGERPLTPGEKAELVRRSNRVQTARQVESRALDNLQSEIDRRLPRGQAPTDQQLSAEIEKMRGELTPCQ